jgi:hypothetical protein
MQPAALLAQTDLKAENRGRLIEASAFWDVR